SPATADFRLRLPVAPTNDELSQLGSAFNRLLDQLQQAFERQQRFTGDAAHQLRTPLTVLMGELDVTLRRPRSPEEYVRTMTLLREQTSELQQLVESLLFLARAEHDAVPPDLRMLDLHSWLPARLDRWRSHPRGADVQFDAALGDRAPLVVRASPELLGQIIDNLVGNALKYSPAGTPVVVSARREEAANRSQAVIAVLDEGQGVAEADREAIFEPFIRTESARRSGAPGAGLGLAVAARIAAALHGRLRCEGREGPGSRFVLTLPLHHATANGLPSAITSA
ncbi:MAG TPA: ATP-binding protein, partial [Pirellulales bacterium]